MTTVTAEGASPGEVSASRVLTVGVDRDTVAQRRVTLGPGERTNVSVKFEARPGTVTVEGVEAGTLQSSNQSGDIPTESPVETERTGFPLGLFLLLLSVVVTLVGVLSAYRMVP
jgi:hypothetical protein